jgi:hypothetical protein
MPRRRRIAFGLSALAAAAAALPAAACEVPEEGAAPYRRLVARVKYLPETEAWAESMSREKRVVQYVLHLDAPRRVGGRCHWIVEVRAADRLWKRFLVAETGGPPIVLDADPAGSAPAGAARTSGMQ